MNLRRLSQQIYSLPPLTAREPPQISQKLHDIDIRVKLDIIMMLEFLFAAAATFDYSYISVLYYDLV